jgi:hypothetical protein
MCPIATGDLDRLWEHFLVKRGIIPGVFYARFERSHKNGDHGFFSLHFSPLSNSFHTSCGRSNLTNVVRNKLNTLYSLVGLLLLRICI